MKIIRVIYNKLIYRQFIRRRMKTCGRNFRLGYSSELLNPEFFEIGNNFFTGPYNYFVTNEFNPVSISDDVMLGPFCKIIGGNHDYHFTGNHMRYNPNANHMNSSIIIEKGAWIGANTTILSGGHISEGAVIGAMSLVNKYVPPYCIAVGIPASRFIRRFSNNNDLVDLLMNTNSQYTLDQINLIYAKYKL